MWASLSLWLLWLLACWLLFRLGLVVWPDVACEDFLTDFIADRLGNAAYQYRLFTNNHTPGTGSVIGSFTEATFGGYAPISGATIVWSAPTLAGHIAQSTGSNIVFNNTSGGSVTVYGVFVTDATGTILYFAERDPNAPITILNGGNYVYTPNQQYKSIN